MDGDEAKFAIGVVVSVLLLCSFAFGMAMLADANDRANVRQCAELCKASGRLFDASHGACRCTEKL